MSTGGRRLVCIMLVLSSRCSGRYRCVGASLFSRRFAASAFPTNNAAASRRREISDTSDKGDISHCRPCDILSSNRRVFSISRGHGSRDTFSSDRRLCSVSRGGGSASNTDETEQSSVETRQPGRARKYTQQAVGVVFSAVGFVTCTAKSLVTNRKQFGAWKRCLQGLDVYLRDSGIHKEISSLVNRRLLGNLIILSRIQFDALRNKDDRDLVRLRRLHRSALPPVEEAARYMKFATAAYGEAMIRAAEMHSQGRIDTEHSPLPKSKIAKHVGLQESDIVMTDLDEDDCNHLRHFIAVDHARRKVILSIRGTFNLAELVVDVAAFSSPFLGGEAHSEMAKMAERVWDKAGDTVRQLLEQGGRDYELIITGHSLGAGTACLLNILIHSDKKKHVKGRQVRAFTYASPPVFAPLHAAPREAIASTTNYIHERDAVPFLSVDSVRHFFACLAVIDEYCSAKKMGFINRQKLVTGFLDPDESLRQAVLRAKLTRLPPRDGAPLLAVPAAANIWIRESDFVGSDNYDARDCDSIRLARRGILLDQNMLFDHFPTKYEHALSRLSKLELK